MTFCVVLGTFQQHMVFCSSSLFTDGSAHCPYSSLHSRSQLHRQPSSDLIPSSDLTPSSNPGLQILSSAMTVLLLVHLLPHNRPWCQSPETPVCIHDNKGPLHNSHTTCQFLHFELTTTSSAAWIQSSLLDFFHQTSKYTKQTCAGKSTLVQCVQISILGKIQLKNTKPKIAQQV